MEYLSTPVQKRIGPGEPPYVIAEIGANHNGDMDLCRKMIDAAADAGAHAVKFQSWTEKSLISNAEYERNTSYSDPHKHFGSLREMVRRYALSEDQHRQAADYCREKGVDFCSSAFSPAEVDLLLSMDSPFIKVASMDVNNRPLLEYLGSTGCQVILSTGMATMEEIDRAMGWLTSSGAGPVCLLHCVSVYPPEHSTIHLNNMLTLESAYDVPVGFSDHTLGVSVPIAAVALGACVIEKHFTLDKDMEGWDHAISADPAELAFIVREGRNVFDALGSTRRTVSEAEQQKKQAFRRCIVLARDVKKGEVLAFEDLDYKRPGRGIAPDEYPYVVGRRMKVDMAADEQLGWDDLE